MRSDQVLLPVKITARGPPVPADAQHTKRLNLGSQAGLLFNQLGKCQVGTEKSVKQIKFLSLAGESNTPTKMLLWLATVFF